MAKEDTTEQVKEVLRQIIKYRFWISIGFAALFAVIAYFMGSGPVKAEADKQIGTIKKAVTAVEAYKSPSKPTDHYKPIVEEKTGIMAKDVNKAWKELYDRQAPLLTWPETVKDRFSKWGRTWPEAEDAGKVRVVIVDYVYAYPAYVDMVYHTFNPFDYETGKGIVAAPSKEELLRPAPFTVESMPGMGKVWAAQERLWIQRTLLEVVRQVNKNPKDWDSAYLKEILGLEVGNPLAQDQQSLAKGQTLVAAPAILAPGETAPTEESGGGGAGMSGPAAGMAGMMSGRGGMGRMGAGAMGAMGGGGGGGAGTQYDDTIYYVTPAVDKNQYKILPVSMTVLINQEHVQDLLVELENSPMSIQVMDFELQRPATRVTKPEKGEMPGGMGGMNGMYGMGRMGMMGGMMGQQAFGGMASQMAMRNQMSMANMAGRAPGMGGMSGMAGRMGMGGMGMGASGKEERKKVDISNVDRKKEREKQAEEIAKRKGPSLFDPYFNIVQVKVYGQARFFNPPPAEAQEQPSLGAAGETPAATAPTGAAPAAASAPAGGTGTTPGPAEKAATPGPAEKAGAAAPDAKSAQPQPGSGATPAKTEAAKPADTGKPEAAKPADAAKPAAPPAEPAKPDAKAAAVKK